MSDREFSNLKRARYPMPEFIFEALHERSLMDVYHARPPYQQNDYVGWITRARREETIQKRLNQMLDELQGGDKYMKMPYRKRSG